MKVLFLVMVILMSCGKDIKLGDNIVIKNQVTASNITLSASRDYNPSRFNPKEVIVANKATYLIPNIVIANIGNTATGWLTLIVGNTKLCYQGTAGNNNQESTQFQPKYSNSDFSGNCPGGTQNPTPSSIQVESGDIIKLSVNGGGCSNKCTFTEVKTVLEIQ